MRQWMHGAVWLLLAVAARRAGAEELPCGPVEAGTIQVDGLLDDWRGVDGASLGGDDANLSATIKCNYDEHTLYLVVDVRDNYFARTVAGKPGEDHFTLTVGGKKVTVWPGDANKIKDKVVGAPKGVKLASALQQHGWAVELAWPMKLDTVSSLGFSATIFDCDSKATPKTERQVSWSGRIGLAGGGQGPLDAFMNDRSMSKQDIWRHLRAGKAHVYGVGRYLVWVTEAYFFIDLPVSSNKAVRDVRVFDPGDGHPAVGVRYIEEDTAAHQREVVAVYRLGGDQLQRLFAVETGKVDGERRIENRVSFVRRGRATDIVVDAAKAVGFDAESYAEAPAGDMQPVLLPWSGDKKTTYRFAGDTFVKATP